MPSSLVAYTSLLLSPAVVNLAHARYFNIANRFIGNDFLESWEWITFDDPTHGRVDYVDKDTALKTNLSSVEDGKFIMRADAYEIVSPEARGRKSVRITSTTSYDEVLLVLDVDHMPTGCSTWPAFWTLSKDGPWPNGGEIDIIEGVNKNDQNLASLHSTPGCTMTDPRSQAGRSVSSDCDSAVNYNQGCGVSFQQPNSYGVGFNANGGGWYALTKTRTDGVKIWFWPRDSESVPTAVRQSERYDMIDTGAWPQADAYFPTDTCDHRTHFNEHIMVFDLTFCGDWAGSAFSDAGCGPATCQDYVDNNPDEFKEAFWAINSLHAYNLIENPPTNESKPQVASEDERKGQSPLRKHLLGSS